MKPIRKIIATGLCAAALVGASVLGTMAYFTDNDVVTNTFTVGKVDISLDELDVDGSTADAERDTENKYHLLPGHEYVKDPTVHIEAGSENCYVFVTVDNQLKDIEWNDDDTYKTISEQINANGWEKLMVNDQEVKLNEIPVYVYDGERTYNDGSLVDNGKNGIIVEKKDSGQDLQVFSKFRIDGANVIARHDETSEAPDGFFYIDDYESETNDKEIKVTAYAVQADGFDTALAAWQATYGK